MMAENHEYQVSDRCIYLQGIIISQFDQYDNHKRPLIMKKKIIQFE